MKYVKLFENWLNEAEVAKPATFDPKKTSKTLIVDISQENMSKLDSESLAAWLYKILNKAYYKKDTTDFDEDTKVSIDSSVIKYVGTGFKSETGQKDKRNRNRIKFAKSMSIFPAQEEEIEGIIWRSESENPTEENDTNTGVFVELKDKKTPVFFITLPSSKPNTIEYADSKLLVPSSKSLIMAPARNSFANAKDFALNSEFNIWTSDSGGFQTITLGNLIMNIQKYLEQGEKISDVKPKPQEIAKALGYEIPDNYAPGQGVETKKA